MKRIKRKVIKVGNSAGVLLNGIILHESGLQIGDTLETEFTENKIVLRKGADNGK